MHEVLRQRLMRRLESLPEAQIYQVLDYVEFLESKYARARQVEPSVLQRFAEGVEDRLRKKAINPNTLREAFQLIAAADRVLSDVSSAGKQILDELGGLGEPAPPRKKVSTASRGPATPPPASPGTSAGGARRAPEREDGPDTGAAGPEPRGDGTSRGEDAGGGS